MIVQPSRDITRAHHSVSVNRVAHESLSAASTHPLELDFEVVWLARPDSFAVLYVEVVGIFSPRLLSASTGD